MTDLTATPVLVSENWDEQKERLKTKFSNLNDEDLDYEEGKSDEMLERVQIKIGKTRDELTAIIVCNNPHLLDATARSLYSWK